MAENSLPISIEVSVDESSVQRSFAQIKQKAESEGRKVGEALSNAVKLSPRAIEEQLVSTIREAKGSARKEMERMYADLFRVNSSVVSIGTKGAIEGHILSQIKQASVSARQAMEKMYADLFRVDSLVKSVGTKNIIESRIVQEISSADKSRLQAEYNKLFGQITLGSAVRSVGTKNFIESKIISDITSVDKSRLQREYNNLFGAVSKNSVMSQDTLWGSIDKRLRGIALLTTEVTRAFFGLSLAVAAVGTPAIFGTRYLKSIEDAKMGLLGTLVTMGQFAEGTNKFEAALGLANKTIQSLEQNALKFGVPLDEILNVFRAITASGLQAGMTLEQIGKSAAIGTVAVRALGLDARQSVQELRDLFMGGIQPASSTLATSLGLRDSDIKKAKADAKAGIKDFYDFIMEQLSGYELVAAERTNTLSGSFDLLGLKLQRLFADQRVFSSVKEAVKGVSDSIATLDKETNKLTFNQQLLDQLYQYNKVVETVVGWLGKLAEVTINNIGIINAFATSMIVAALSVSKFGALTLLVGWLKGISAAFIAAREAAMVFAVGHSAAMTQVVGATAGAKAATIAAVGKTGFIGLILFGGYLLADAMGWLDTFFGRFEQYIESARSKIKGMTLFEKQERLGVVESNIQSLTSRSVEGYNPYNPLNDFIQNSKKAAISKETGKVIFEDEYNQLDDYAKAEYGELERIQTLIKKMEAERQGIREEIKKSMEPPQVTVGAGGMAAYMKETDALLKGSDWDKRREAQNQINSLLLSIETGKAELSKLQNKSIPSGDKEALQDNQKKIEEINSRLEASRQHIEKIKSDLAKPDPKILKEAKKDLQDFLATQRDLYAAANSAIDAQLDAGSINLAQAYEMRNEESRKHIDVLKQTTKDKTELAKYDADLIKFQSANFEKFVADYTKSADKLKGITQSILPEDTSEVGKINKQIAELTKEYDNYASGLTKAKSKLESFSNSSKPLTEAQIAQKATLEALIAKYPGLSDKYNEAKKYAELFLKPLAAINDELGRAEKELGLQKDLIDLEAIKNGGTELDNFIAKQKTYGVLQEELRVKVKALTQAEQHLQDVRREFGEDSTNFKSAADKVNDLRKGVIGAQKAVAGLANETDRTFGAGAKRAIENYEKSLGDVATSAEQLFTKAFKSIEDALVDAFMGAKVDIKAIFKSLLADIVRMFVRQTIMVPIVGEFMGTQGGPGAASFGSNLFGNAAGSSMAAWAGNAGFDAIYGSALHGTALGTFGESAAISMSNGAGMMANLGEAASLIGEGSIASGLGAAAPYAAAALVIADAVGAFGKRGGPQQGQYGQVGAGGYSSSFTMSGGDALGNQALSQSAYAQAAALYAMAGKKVADLTIQQGYKLDPQGSASGVAYRNILVGGKTLTGGTFDGNNGAQWTGSNSDAAGAANFLGKLNTAEIVALVKEIADPKLSAAAEALLANFGELEKSLPAWLAAQDTQKAMTQSLMTSEEKAAETSKNLKEKFDALGMSMPTSTSGLKSLVDGLDLTTQSGQDTLASLKDLVPAFVAFDQQTQATRDALEQQMDGVAKAIEAMGMTALEKSLSDISAATRAAIEQAAKLSATEEQLAKVRELGAKQAAALLGSEASKAYTGLLTASGKQIEAMQFQLAEAQAAYSTAVSALADDNKISIDQVNEYIQKAGSLDAAAKQYWGELGDAQDAQTQRKKQLLIEMVNAAAAVDTIDKQLADARVAAQKESNDAQLAAQKEASDQLSALMAQRLEWQTQLDILQGKTTQQQLDRERQLASITDVTTQSIMRQVFALQDQNATIEAANKAREASIGTAKSAIDDAMQAIQQAIDAEKKSAQGRIDAAKKQLDAANALVSTLESGAKRIRGDSNLEGDMAGARQVIDAALQGAFGGAMPDQAQISDAIDSLSRGMDATAYATEEQSILDRAMMAAKLDTLGSIAGVQKSAAEQAVSALEIQITQLGAHLDMARQQVDAVMGVNQSVLTVVQAINNLGGALAAYKAAAAAPILVPNGNGGTSQIIYEPRISGGGGYAPPSFADGGLHYGGLRLVGENGPELEVTGPSRIYNARQTQDMLSGGNAAAEEIRALRSVLETLLTRIERNTLDTSRGVHGSNAAPILVEIAA